MGDNEIIKALEQILRSCFRRGTFYDVIKNTLSLINHLQAENEKLAKDWSDVTIEKDELFDIAEKQKAEIEKWKAEHKRACAERDARICTNNFIRAEAIKEFAERLREYINGIIERHEMPMFPFSVAFVSGMEAKIDNLVKEMVGEDKVQWLKEGECPMTPEQFNAIYDDEMVGEKDAKN